MGEGNPYDVETRLDASNRKFFLKSSKQRADLFVEACGPSFPPKCGLNTSLSFTCQKIVTLYHDYRDVLPGESIRSSIYILLKRDVMFFAVDCHVVVSLTRRFVRLSQLPCFCKRLGLLIVCNISRIKTSLLLLLLLLLLCPFWLLWKRTEIALIILPDSMATYGS